MRRGGWREHVRAELRAREGRWRGLRRLLERRERSASLTSSSGSGWKRSGRSEAPRGSSRNRPPPRSSCGGRKASRWPFRRSFCGAPRPRTASCAPGRPSPGREGDSDRFPLLQAVQSAEVEVGEGPWVPGGPGSCQRRRPLAGRGGGGPSAPQALSLPACQVGLPGPGPGGADSAAPGGRVPRLELRSGERRAADGAGPGASASAGGPGGEAGAGGPLAAGEGAGGHAGQPGHRAGGEVPEEGDPSAGEAGTGWAVNSLLGCPFPAPRHSGVPRWLEWEGSR